MAVTTEKHALDPLDFLALDALLDDEERAIRDTVRQFVRERVLPEVGDWFEEGILPRELMGELAKLGLYGMHLDGYGLPGASAVAYGLTCLELEAGDAVHWHVARLRAFQDAVHLRRHARGQFGDRRPVADQTSGLRQELELAHGRQTVLEAEGTHLGPGQGGEPVGERQ